MAYKLKITPQFGTQENSSDLTLSLSGLKSQTGLKIKIENATHNLALDEFELNAGENSVNRKVNLRIPEYASDSMISVFVSIEEKNKDGIYKIKEVIPIAYHIEETASSTNTQFNVTPSFTSKNGTCEIAISGKTDDKYVVSINDKKFNIIINPKGEGTIHFKTQDVLTEDINVIKKIPVYYYVSSDGFVTKKFSGTYLNVIPENIQVSVDEIPDPRCTPTYDPNTWEPAPWCIENPLPKDGPYHPCVTHEMPVKIEDCTSETLTTEEDAKCINSFSSTLLPNGMALHAYTSIDDSDTSDADNIGEALAFFLENGSISNTNRIFLTAGETAIDAQVATHDRVTIFPKEGWENFLIQVTEDVVNKIIQVNEEGRSVIAVFFHEDFGYQSFSVIETYPDEYFGVPTLLVSRGVSNITVTEEMSCVYTLFYEFTPTEEGGDSTEPSLDWTGLTKLDYIPFAAIHRVSLSSNTLQVRDDGEAVVHLIAEAYDRITSKIQLYYYGLTIGLNDSYISLNSGDWQKLTTQGNNKNVKTVCDRNNNIHIFWESDRNGIEQIYYGVIGPSSVFYCNSTLSSILDKQAELNQREDNIVLGLSSDILETVEVTNYFSDFLSEYDEPFTSGILNNAWIKNETNSGTTTVTDNSTIQIQSDTSVDTAMAFTQLNASNGFDIEAQDYSNLNYQLSFNFNSEIVQDKLTFTATAYQELLSDSDINAIYALWEDTYTLYVDEDLFSIPIHILNDNRYQLGRQDAIYDRLIPIAGSYYNSQLYGEEEGNTITDNFVIEASGDDFNLRHFFLAIMPEKVRFKAQNLETETQFTDRTGLDASLYDTDDIQEIYTGKAVLAMVYHSDDMEVSHGKRSTIVRKVSEPFSLYTDSQIEIMVNYSKMFEEDVYNYLNITNYDTTLPRFACSIILLKDSQIQFAETFITDLTVLEDEYTQSTLIFDIGLGVSSKGYFTADKFLPYNSSIFEKANVTFNYGEIILSSPTYQVDDSIAIIPSYAKEQLNFMTDDIFNNTFETTEQFFSHYDFFYDSLVDAPSVMSEFMQIPITLDGINSDVAVELGFANDVHITWQSNRDRNWNVFYSNSTDKGLPFRFDAQISNNENENLSPDIAVGHDGEKMIVWHNNKYENYQILSARSTVKSLNVNDVCATTASTDEQPENPNVVSLTYQNDTVSNENLQFRIIFYADSMKTRTVYSSYTLTDIKRWYSIVDAHEPFNASGLTVAPNESVEIIYVPEVYPQQLNRQQSANIHRTITDAEITEFPLLSGIRYYVDVEIYDTVGAELISTVSTTFESPSLDVEQGLWREDVYAKNWICSGQGNADLLVSNSGDYSVFPVVASSAFGFFQIAHQSQRGDTNLIVRSIWDVGLDKVYGSGQGYYEAIGPNFGTKPTILTDHSQNFYIASKTCEDIHVFNCAFPICEEETVTVETVAEALATISSNILMKVQEEDIVNSLTINRDEVVAVVDKTNINLDVSGVPGAYAVRLRNQDGDWSDWISIRNATSCDGSLVVTASDDAYFIDYERFIVNWDISRINGVRRICIQVVTFYGITETYCINIFANMETINYEIKLYQYDGVDTYTEATKYQGKYMLTTLKTIVEGVITGETSPTTYKVEIIFTEDPKLSGDIGFHVIQQGRTDTYFRPLTAETVTTYTGTFNIYKDDRVFNKDGLSFIRVIFPNEFASENECESDQTDIYNSILTDREQSLLQDTTPEQSYQTYITRVSPKIIDLNEFKQYYINNSGNFVFGDVDYFKDKKV